MTLFSLLTIMLFFFACNGPVDKPEMIGVDDIESQLLLLDKNVRQEIATSPMDGNGEEKIVPRRIEKDGSLAVVAGGDWTSGFFPGTLWYLYELTGKEGWKDMAVEYTEKLQEHMFNGSNHDVGFRMFCSYSHNITLSYLLVTYNFFQS